MTADEIEKLIARLEERDKTKHGFFGYVLFNRDGPEAATALRAMQAERDAKPSVGVNYEEAMAKARARAAEAKLTAAEARLAEVEKEREEAKTPLALAWRWQCRAEIAETERDELRATVATLTAQVEAMRLSAMKAMTIANGALDPTATEKTFRRDLVQIREELRGSLWPAALTTEKTNG